MTTAAISWSDVERATRGRIIQARTTCPFCSHLRRNRRERCLDIQQRSDDYAVFHCHHCDAGGNVFRDSLPRRVNPAEQQRRQIITERRFEVERQEKIAAALDIWGQRKPFRGSPAEVYLIETRGIGEWLDTFAYLDQVFGYHPRCPFGSDRHPAMLALVRDIKTDDPVAIHRTALTLDSRPQKIGRKALGPTSGGAIKISPDFDVHSGLLVGEGIETVLSASAQFSFKPAWSLIDRNHVAKFPVLPGIECLTVAVDNDASGDGQRAAQDCIYRQVAAGVEVISVQPNLAKDFNDILKGKTNV